MRSIPSAGDAVAAIRAIVPGGVDVALECAGVPETFRQSLAVVRHGGAAVLFGVMAKGQRVEVEPFDLLVREVRLEPALSQPAHAWAGGGDDRGGGAGARAR